MVSYSPELANLICQRVASGESVSKICRNNANMPTAHNFFEWRDKFPEVGTQYARAVSIRADARADRIDEISDKMLNGIITSDVARVAIDVEKWQAGKENPKKYSDNKHQIELTGKDGEPLSVRLMAAQARLLKDITPQPELIENKTE